MRGHVGQTGDSPLKWSKILGYVVLLVIVGYFGFLAYAGIQAEGIGWWPVIAGVLWVALYLLFVFTRDGKQGN